MSEPTTKRRGRPPTGTAKTSTERSRAMRRRVQSVFDVGLQEGHGNPLEPFADSLLLCAFEQAYRERLRSFIAVIGAELFRRAGVAATVNDRVAATTIKTLEDQLAASRAVDATIKKSADATINKPVAATDKPQPDLTPSGHWRFPESSLEDFAAKLPPPKQKRASKTNDRDRRILELAGLSEIKVAETLNAEGIKCSPRTVGNVRRRSAGA